MANGNFKFYKALVNILSAAIALYGIFKVGPIKYINNSSNKKIAFNRLGLFLMAGYVTPEVNEVIYDESSLAKFEKQYIRFIFSGIIITIIIMIIASILLVFNKLIILNLLIVIFNWPILIKALDNENLSYGDFYLINLLKNKPDYICAVLQNNLVVEYPLNYFIVTKIENFLNTSINTEDYDDLILGLADKVLDEYIIEEKKLNYELGKLKEWVFNCYESVSSSNIVSIISIIKVSHKFLLYLYALKMKSEFTHNYNKMWTYLSKSEPLINNKFIGRIMSTLKYLYEDRNLLDEDFKYIISDLEFMVSESDNYRRKVSLIVDRLSRKSMEI